MVIVTCEGKNNLGQFVFTKSILVEKGIIQSQTKKGKLGFRVYPIWDKTNNNQADKSQKWQLDYFINLSCDTSFNFEKAKLLYQL